MELTEIFDQMKVQVEDMDPIQAKMKLVMGEHIFLIDGTGERNIVSQDDVDANCVVKTDLNTFYKMKSGKLNPILALMEGKINIDGSMGLAFKMKSLLA